MDYRLYFIYSKDISRHIKIFQLLLKYYIKCDILSREEREKYEVSA